VHALSLRVPVCAAQVSAAPQHLGTLRGSEAERAEELQRHNARMAKMRAEFAEEVRGRGAAAEAVVAQGLACRGCAATSMQFSSMILL